MGLLDRLLKREDRPPRPPASEIAVVARAQESSSGNEAARSAGHEISLVKLSGTTTIAKDTIVGLATRHGQADSGYLVLAGTIQREADNPVDPNAVAVYVEGDRIAYLPGYIAREVSLSNNGSAPVIVQIFTELLAKGPRCEAWAWLAEVTPQWDWDETHRPPMSSKAKAQAHQTGVNAMVSEALDSGGARADQFRAGMADGVHYLQLVEPIKQLKRDGRLEDALTLCHAAIDGAEAAAKLEKLEPAPWYTEQAAIVCRKLGRPAEERAVLERWIAACPPGRGEHSRIKERLDTLPRN